MVGGGSGVGLGIAVTREGAGGSSSGDRPVFVVEYAGSIHCYGIAPCQSPISRTADEHIDGSMYRVNDPKPGDHPDLVLGVVGNRWVTRTGILRVFRR